MASASSPSGDGNLNSLLLEIDEKKKASAFFLVPRIDLTTLTEIHAVSRTRVSLNPSRSQKNGENYKTRKVRQEVAKDSLTR